MVVKLWLWAEVSDHTNEAVVAVAVVAAAGEVNVVDGLAMFVET